MATAVITTSSLTGPRKAAIALLSLDEELASQVLSKMSLGDVRRLCEAVEDLGDVGGELIQLVLNDLERGLSDPLAMARASGPAYLRKLADRRSARTARRKRSASKRRTPNLSTSSARRASACSRSCSPTSIRRSRPSC